MFFHIFSNRFKSLLRSRELVFWTILFPILLGTLFNLAFSNLNSHEVFKTINIAVINNDQNKIDNGFKSVLSKVSEKNGDKKPLFNVNFVDSKKKADNLLKDNKVDGYIYKDGDLNLFIKQNGLNQTIIKTFLDEYKQKSYAITEIIKNEPLSFQKGLLEKVPISKNIIKDVPVGKSKPNNVLNYFYTLIAMACLYGSFWGSNEIRDIQANLSPVGARVNLTPVSKIKIYLYRYLAVLLIHFTEMLVVLAYLIFVLNIDFGSQTLYVLFATFIGSLTGISFGTFVSVLVKKSESIKTAILIGTTMFLSFLSGMMFEAMKYIVATNAPILSYINPANLLTDAFYSLYYYDTLNKYFLNMSILIVFAVVFSSISILVVRRQKYASI